jgi:hypothetical protein
MGRVSGARVEVEWKWMPAPSRGLMSCRRRITTLSPLRISWSPILPSRTAVRTIEMNGESIRDR